MQETFKSYGIFAFGSTSYPNFCGFGKKLDLILHKLGANRMVKVILQKDIVWKVHKFI